MLSTTKKRGGIPLDRHKIAPLLDFSNELHLIDIEFSGPEFTWSNRQCPSTLIDERLDKFFLNDAWLDSFPETPIEHLPPLCSDHCLIVMRTMPASPITKTDSFVVVVLRIISSSPMS
ncbi:hypothetical protein LINPERPRIM_LOCUS16962 [Linum perenne]